ARASCARFWFKRARASNVRCGKLAGSSRTSFSASFTMASTSSASLEDERFELASGSASGAEPPARSDEPTARRGEAESGGLEAELWDDMASGCDSVPEGTTPRRVEPTARTEVVSPVNRSKWM